jgi:hypothetical protein
MGNSQCTRLLWKQLARGLSLSLSLVLRPSRARAGFVVMGKHFSPAELDNIAKWKDAGWTTTQIYERPGLAVLSLSPKSCLSLSSKSSRRKGGENPDDVQGAPRPLFRLLRSYTCDFVGLKPRGQVNLQASEGVARNVCLRFRGFVVAVLLLGSSITRAQLEHN